MLRRVNPVVLISLITVLILSIAIFAVANTGGGRDAALGAATGQVGMPYGFGTDGPGSFSCTGLVRHALRSAGVDPNAPWDHMAYLGAYPTVSEPQPGDVVVYPDGAAMYVGNGQVVMANHADGVVGLYGMNEIGTPVGFANPYGGAVDPAISDPAAVQPAGQMAVDQGLAPIDQGLAPVDQGLAPIDQGLAPIDQGLAPVDQGLVPAAVNQYLP
jgi:cell wall-associated NlpC family hydrolase